VDAGLRELMTSLDDVTLAKLAPTIELGLHHEQQHQELLLMDIKHVLSMSPLDPVYQEGPPGGPGPVPPASNWLKHDGGLVSVGHGGHGFAYDNEGPSH